MSVNARNNQTQNFEAVATIGRYQVGLLAEARQRFLGQIADVAKAWSDGVNRSKEAEATYARRLIDCHSLEEATEVYLEWLTSVANGLMIESQRLGNKWLNVGFSSGAQRDKD